MIFATFLLLLLGALFMAVGILYKRLPDSVRSEDVMFWYSLISLFCLLPAVLCSGTMKSIPPVWLAGLSLIGSCNIFGMLLLQTAMKRGNSGVAWALTQSALIGPFLIGMFFFGEKHSVWGISGLCLVLFGMICQAERKAGRSSPIPCRIHYLFLAWCAFLCCTISQTVLTISCYSKSQMSGVDKTFLLTLGAVCGLLVFKQTRSGKFFDLSGKMIFYAVILAFFSLGSMLTLFLALDRLALYSRAGLAYPVSLGCCIAAFTLYSAFIEKERLKKLQILGLISIITGIFLLGF